MTGQRNTRCSFCGKHQDETEKLIAAPGVYICEECVWLCCEILMDEADGIPGWAPPARGQLRTWSPPGAAPDVRISRQADDF